MIVGTAGHIDHGKTSLVGKLTGVDTDRLKEEKARGISIDLGFAYWPRPSGDIVGFVDVPGHEGLVHNMLAGATGIDFVVLVIAADDGVMPQTREHLAIMDLLGLQQGLVALNKCDLVGEERLAVVTREIEVALAGTGLAGSPIVPVSAVTGAGLEALAAHLDAALARTTARPREARFRLAVDRAFTLPGLGTAVTGTVLSGTVRTEDRVLVSPSGLEARVRSIHAQNRPVRAGRGRTKMCARAERTWHQQGSGAARRCRTRPVAARTDRAHRCQPARAGIGAQADRAVVPGQGAPRGHRGTGPHRRAAR